MGYRSALLSLQRNFREYLILDVVGKQPETMSRLYQIHNLLRNQELNGVSGLSLADSKLFQ